MISSASAGALLRCMLAYAALDHRIQGFMLVILMLVVFLGYLLL